uniref:Uncharacterized protein n=1 Tax=Cacopsylla melanoneura TaxID=428564 RepID=A0A8D8XPR9_9HEMI
MTEYENVHVIYCIGIEEASFQPFSVGHLEDNPHCFGVVGGRFLRYHGHKIHLLLTNVVYLFFFQLSNSSHSIFFFFVSLSLLLLDAFLFLILSQGLQIVFVLLSPQRLVETSLDSLCPCSSQGVFIGRHNVH